MAKNRVIGKDNKLPWQHSKEDFAFFREKTMNKTVVVGPKTFNHMPILKGRHPLIMETRYDRSTDPKRKGWPCGEPGTEGFHYTWTETSPAQLKENIENSESYRAHSEKDMVCIGGAKTYEICLPYISSFFVTEWQFDCEGDTVMPPFKHLFPVRRQIKEIEDGRGIIYEYMTGDKFMEEYPGVTVEFP